MVTAASAVESLVTTDQLLAAIRRESNRHRESHGTYCDVFPSDAKTAQLLAVLAGLRTGRRALDIGCGLGTTAIVLARLLREGRVDTIERDPAHAALARENFAMAHVSSRIKVLEGAAEEVLPSLRGKYDLIVEDATAFRIPAYYEDVVRLARPGAFIVWDNWFPLDPGRSDISDREIRATLAWARRAFRDRRLRTTLVHPGAGLSVRV